MSAHLDVEDLLQLKPPSTDCVLAHHEGVYCPLMSNGELAKLLFEDYPQGVPQLMGLGSTSFSAPVVHKHMTKHHSQSQRHRLPHHKLTNIHERAPGKDYQRALWTEKYKGRERVREGRINKAERRRNRLVSSKSELDLLSLDGLSLNNTGKPSEFLLSFLESKRVDKARAGIANMFGVTPGE